MSVMSNICLEIEESLTKGSTPQQIAAQMNIPIDWVFATEANLMMDTQMVDSDGYEF